MWSFYIFAPKLFFFLCEKESALDFLGKCFVKHWKLTSDNFNNLILLKFKKTMYSRCLKNWISSHHWIFVHKWYSKADISKEHNEHFIFFSPPSRWARRQKIFGVGCFSLDHWLKINGNMLSNYLRVQKKNEMLNVCEIDICFEKSLMDK